MPLVLNLHGSESAAQGQELFTGMDATSDADGFIVAYPQALIPAGSGYDWNIPGVPLLGGQYPPANAANDVTFLTGLVSVLAANTASMPAGCTRPACPAAGGWPASSRATRRLAANATMWAFFQAHPLPA